MCEMCEKIKSERTNKYIRETDYYNYRNGISGTFKNFIYEDVLNLKYADYKYCPKCGELV